MRGLPTVRAGELGHGGGASAQQQELKLVRESLLAPVFNRNPFLWRQGPRRDSRPSDSRGGSAVEHGKMRAASNGRYGARPLHSKCRPPKASCARPGAGSRALRASHNQACPLSMNSKKSWCGMTKCPRQTSVQSRSIATQLSYSSCPSWLEIEPRRAWRGLRPQPKGAAAGDRQPDGCNQLKRRCS